MMQSEDIETLFQFIIVQVIVFSEKIMHVQKVGAMLKNTIENLERGLKGKTKMNFMEDSDYRFYAKIIKLLFEAD